MFAVKRVSAVKLGLVEASPGQAIRTVGGGWEKICLSKIYCLL